VTTNLALPLICLAKSFDSCVTQWVPTIFANKIITLGSIRTIEYFIVGGASLSARAFTTRYISLYLKSFKDYFLSLLNFLNNSLIYYYFALIVIISARGTIRHASHWIPTLFTRQFITIRAHTIVCI
jgi:hypothetical protein